MIERSTEVTAVLLARLGQQDHAVLLTSWAERRRIEQAKGRYTRKRLRDNAEKSRSYNSVAYLPIVVNAIEMLNDAVSYML